MREAEREREAFHSERGWRDRSHPKRDKGLASVLPCSLPPLPLFSVACVLLFSPRNRTSEISMRLRRAAAARRLFLYVHTVCVTCRLCSRRQNGRKTFFFPLAPEEISPSSLFPCKLKKGNRCTRLVKILIRRSYVLADKSPCTLRIQRCNDLIIITFVIYIGVSLRKSCLLSKKASETVPTPINHDVPSRA